MKKILSLFVLLAFALVPFMVYAVGPTAVTATYNLNNPRATYGYVEIGATPVSACTDLAVLYGSATKTIKIKKVTIEQASTSAGAVLNVSLVKRTAVNTGGTTTTTATISKFDSGNATVTASPVLYTANASALGAGTSIAEGSLVFSTTNPNKVVFNFTEGNGTPVTLRGVAQGLALYLNAQTKPSGGTVSISYEFEEL